MKTLVFGASLNPSRYSYLCMQALTRNGFEAVGIGLKEGKVGDVPVLKGSPDLEGIHTITMYMNDMRQQEFHDYLLGLNPKRIIFNPGAENQELASLARARDIEVVENCSLVMMSLGQYDPISA